jgi:hypothetical protein
VNESRVSVRNERQVRSWLDFVAVDLVSPQVPKSVAGVAVSTIAAAL